MEEKENQPPKDSIELLADTPNGKGLVIATKEEVMKWRKHIELPEETPWLCPGGVVLPGTPSIGQTILPGDFLLRIKDGRITLATRQWNPEKKRWAWWENRDDGCTYCFRDDEVLAWLKVPDWFPSPNNNQKEEDE